MLVIAKGACDPATAERAAKLIPFILEEERLMRLGETDEYSPGKFYFISEDRVLPLLGHSFGEPQHHPKLDEKDQFMIVAKLVTAILQAKCVVFSMENWTADRCGHCGIETLADICPACGQKRMMPRDNPYRQESLMLAVVRLISPADYECHAHNATVWTYNIVRDENQKILEFAPDKEALECHLQGRMVDFWAISPIEAPHFLLNYQEFCSCLGVECPENMTTGAALVRATVPADYQLLSWRIDDDMKRALDSLSAPFN